MYEIAGHLLRHKVAVQNEWSHSVARCERCVLIDHSTLNRYAFVPVRICPAEFGQRVLMSDRWGHPCGFRDLVETASMSVTKRGEEITRRLENRTAPPGRKGRCQEER